MFAIDIFGRPRIKKELLLAASDIKSLLFLGATFLAVF